MDKNLTRSTKQSAIIQVITVRRNCYNRFYCIGKYYVSSLIAVKYYVT